MSDDPTQPMWTPPEAEAGAARPRAAQRLLAAAWRHPGLIVPCALAGAVVATALSSSLRHPAPLATATAARAQVERTPLAADGAAPAVVLAGASAAADCDALLKRAPPAGSGVVAHRDGVAAVPGLVAGLLLGLLAAAARELRGGDRLRSAREAERALGVLVLGGVPTLSGRARRALLAAAARR